MSFAFGVADMAIACVTPHRRYMPYPAWAQAPN